MVAVGVRLSQSQSHPQMMYPPAPEHGQQKRQQHHQQQQQQQGLSKSEAALCAAMAAQLSASNLQPRVLMNAIAGR